MGTTAAVEKKKISGSNKAPEVKLSKAPDMKRVDGDVCRAAAKALGLEGKGKIEDVVYELQQKFGLFIGEKNDKGEDVLLECSDCGGKSPDSLEKCPFCGSADDVEIAPATATETSELAAEIAAAEPTTQVKKKKSKASNRATVELNGAISLSSESKGSSLTIAAPLDKAVREVAKIAGEGAVWAWKMGDYVRREIYEPELWKLRLDEKGKPLYHGFDQFVKAEIKMSKTFVYRMMEVSKAYSIEEARKYGTTQLRNLIGAPPEDRKLLAERIDSGDITSTRGLAEEVREIRERKGVTQLPGAGTKKDTKKLIGAAIDGQKEKKPENIAITIPYRKSRATMFAKPDTRGGEERPVKRVADLPCARIEGGNGVTIHIRVVQSAAGHLVIEYEPKRNKE